MRRRAIAYGIACCLLFGCTTVPRNETSSGFQNGQAPVAVLFLEEWGASPDGSTSIGALVDRGSLPMGAYRFDMASKVASGIIILSATAVQLPGDLDDGDGGVEVKLPAGTPKANYAVFDGKTGAYLGPIDTRTPGGTFTNGPNGWTRTDASGTTSILSPFPTLPPLISSSGLTKSAAIQ